MMASFDKKVHCGYHSRDGCGAMLYTMFAPFSVNVNSEYCFIFIKKKLFGFSVFLSYD